jgi:hypothetical protein
VCSDRTFDRKRVHFSKDDGWNSGEEDPHPSDAESELPLVERQRSLDPQVPYWVAQDNVHVTDRSRKPNLTGDIIYCNGAYCRQIGDRRTGLARIFQDWNRRHIWLPTSWLRFNSRISQKLRRRKACNFLALMVGQVLRCDWGKPGVPRALISFLFKCQIGARDLGQLYIGRCPLVGCELTVTNLCPHICKHKPNKPVFSGQFVKKEC